MLGDRAARLRVLAGDTPEPVIVRDNIHYRYERQAMSSSQFISNPPRSFKCDLIANDRTYTISFILQRETSNCLYFIGELGIGTRDYYLAPVYVFKKNSNFARGLMRIIPLERSPETWNILSAAHFEGQFRHRLREGERAPDPFLECFRLLRNRSLRKSFGFYRR